MQSNAWSGVQGAGRSSSSASDSAGPGAPLPPSHGRLQLAGQPLSPSPTGELRAAPWGSGAELSSPATEDAQRPRAAGSNRDLPLRCTFEGCGKLFKDKKVLRKHMMTHQPRRFHCEHPGCGKSFYERAKLKRHNLVHSGEKNFICTFEGCNKRFALKANLQTHFRVHTGTRPFACPFPGCPKRFSQTSGRNSHYKTHLKRNKRGADAAGLPVVANPKALEPLRARRKLSSADDENIFDQPGSTSSSPSSALTRGLHAEPGHSSSSAGPSPAPLLGSAVAEARHLLDAASLGRSGLGVGRFGPPFLGRTPLQGVSPLAMPQAASYLHLLSGNGRPGDVPDTVSSLRPATGFAEAKGSSPLSVSASSGPSSPSLSAGALGALGGLNSALLGGGGGRGGGPASPSAHASGSPSGSCSMLLDFIKSESYESFLRQSGVLGGGGAPVSPLQVQAALQQLQARTDLERRRQQLELLSGLRLSPEQLTAALMGRRGSDAPGWRLDSGENQ